MKVASLAFVLMLGVGNMWGEKVTYTFTDTKCLENKTFYTGTSSDVMGYVSVPVKDVDGKNAINIGCAIYNNMKTRAIKYDSSKGLTFERPGAAYFTLSKNAESITINIKSKGAALGVAGEAYNAATSDNVLTTTNKLGESGSSGGSFTVKDVKAGSYKIYSTQSISGSSSYGIISIEITYAAVSCTTPPTVSAGSKSDVTSTTAMVSCSGISSLGSTGCSITDYGFVIGTSANPTIGGTGVTKHQVGTTYTTTGTSFTKSLTGLTASTTYYVRPYATNGAGTAYGTQTDFTTSAPVPTYTVTYKAGEGTGDDKEEQYAENAEVTLPACTFTAPTGKEFDAWTSTDVAISDGKFTMPAKAVTVTATWKVKSYTISKNPINCSFDVPQSVEHGGSFEVTVTPNTGYNLPDDVIVINATKDWNKSTGVLQVTNVTGQPQVTVECVAKTTTVTLDNQGATKAGQTSVTATYGQPMPSIASNLPEKDGAEFGGYYTEPDGAGTQYIKADGKSAKNWNFEDATKTLYAYWVKCTPLVATASFSAKAVGCGTSYNKDTDISKDNVTVTVNGSSDTGHPMTKPAIKGKQNTTILTFVIPDDVVEGTISVGACTYSGTATTMKIYKGDSEIKSASLTSNHKINSPDNTSWVDPTLCTISTSITSGGTYYVKETGNKSNVYIYSFSVSANNGCTADSYTVTYKDGSTTLGTEEVVVGEHPTAEGINTAKSFYTFNSWQLNGVDKALSEISGTKDQEITLTARYTYTPIYAGSINLETEAAGDKTAINTFFSNNNYFSSIGTSGGYDATGDAGYHGYKFKDNGDWIEFLLQDGHKATIEFGYAKKWTINYGSESETYTNENKSYIEKTYTATGGDMLIKLTNTTSTSCIRSITITANTYTVTFDANGHGTAPEAQTGIQPGGTATKPADPTANGYTFGGWYENAECTGSAFDFSTAINANKTLYAKWNPVTYTITFENLQGTTKAPQEYTIESETFELTGPEGTYQGHTFDGWYDGAGGTGNKVESITKGSTGNKTLYAKWTQEPQPSECDEYTFIQNGVLNSKFTTDRYLENVPVAFTFSDGKSFTQCIKPSSVTKNTCSKSKWQYVSITMSKSVGIFTIYAYNKSSNPAQVIIWKDGTDLVYESQTIASNNGDVVTYTDQSAEGHTFYIGLYNGDENNYQMYIYNILVSDCSGSPSPTTYTVTYAKGDEAVTGSVPTQEDVAEGRTFTVAGKGSLAWTGHSFTGWEDQDGESVAAGDTYTMPAKAVTLTARWTENLAVITFAASPANTGTFKIGDAAATSAQAGVATKPAVTAVPATGYNFTSWAISGGSHSISSTSTNPTTITGDGTTTAGTLTATFTAKTYTVTLDNQSATTAGAANVTVTYGEAIPSIASNLPAKTNYTFEGYFDSQSSGTKYINADGSSAKNWDKDEANPKLYAKWAKELLTPEITWNTVPEKVYAGGQYELKVTATTDATLTKDNIVFTATNATITELAVDNNVITAYLEMNEEAASAPELSLTLPQGTEYAGGEFTRSDITLGDCSEPKEVIDNTTHTGTFTGSSMPSVSGGTWTVSGGGSSDSRLKISGSDNYLKYEFNSAVHLKSVKMTYSFNSKDKMTWTMEAKNESGTVIGDTYNGEIQLKTSSEMQTQEFAFDREDVKSFTIVNTSSKNMLFTNVTFSIVTGTSGGDGPQDPELAWKSGVTTKSVDYQSANFTELATAKSAGAITYSSDAPSVASVNSTTGEVTIGNAGSATITASIAESGCFEEDAITYTITVNKLKLATPTVTTNYTEAAYYDCEKDNVTPLIVTATNNDKHGSTLSYQWYKGEDAISEATTETYTPTETGLYKCVVTCSLDDNYESASASSDAKTITFYPATTFTTNPVSATYTKGESMTDLTVVATGGNGGFTYQWQESTDGTNWENSTKDGYNTATLTMGTAVNDGSTPIITYYRCLVYTDGKCETASETAMITINSKNNETLTWTGLDKTFYAGGQYTITIEGIHACPDWTTSANVDEKSNTTDGNKRTVTFVIKDNVTAVAFTASIAEDATYFAKEETKDLNIGECASAPVPQLTWSDGLKNEHVFNVAPNATLTTYTASSNSVSAGAISYASDNTNVATVDEKTGEVTLVADATGDATITATQAASGCFKEASITYKVVVRKTATIAISGNTSANQGEKVVLTINTNSTATPTVSVTADKGVIVGTPVAKSAGVYTVDVIAEDGAESATITASVADNGEFAAAQAEYDLTVNPCETESKTIYEMHLTGQTTNSVIGGKATQTGIGTETVTVDGKTCYKLSSDDSNVTFIPDGGFIKDDVLTLLFTIAKDKTTTEGYKLYDANDQLLKTCTASVDKTQLAEVSYTFTAATSSAYITRTQSNQRFYGAKVTREVPVLIETTLEWDEDLSEGVRFEYDGGTMHELQHVAHTTTSAGTITYESSDENIATVNETTGVVTQVGYGEVTITATLAAIGCYKSATTSYDITFIDCANQPTIFAPTEDKELTYTEDTKVILQVSAAPSDKELDLSYQWYKDNEAVEGATAALYEFTANSDKAGTYYCIVSETDGCKTPKSASITITVVADEPDCENYVEIIGTTVTGEKAHGTITGSIGGDATVAFASASKDDNDGYKMGADGSYMTLTLGKIGDMQQYFQVGDQVSVEVTTASKMTHDGITDDHAIYLYTGTKDNFAALGSIPSEECATAGVKTYTITAIADNVKEISLYREGGKMNPFIKSMSVSRKACDEGLMQFVNATGDGKWSTAENWIGTTIPATELPTAGTITQIKKSVLVDKTDAMSARVDLYDGSQLEIASTAALQVTGTVKRADGNPTEVSDIYIHSDATGTGALIFDNSDDEQLAKATMEYYSKASGAPDNCQWQWAATPFSDVNDVQYNYYGAWLSPWVNSTKGWGAMMKNGDGMTPFEGYCISRKEAGIFWMQGTLVSTEDRLQSLDYQPSLGNRAGLNIIGNSWSAPINIHQWEVSDFVNAEATIVILNTGLDESGEGTASMGSSEAGQYISIPVKAAKLMDGALQVIPSMQAFQVRATGTGASVKMNYDQLVRKSNGGIDIQPMRAPSRTASADIDPAEVVALRIDIKGARYSDFLYLFQHSQFSSAFDNGWDGEKVLGDINAVQLYVLPAKGEYAVSAQPELVGTQFGFYRGEDESYTITFDYNGTDRLFLHDANTDIYTEVKNGNSYTFSSYTFDLEKRFTLTDTNPYESIITDYNEVKANEAPFKFIQDEHLYIRNHHRIFDGQGKHVK